MWVEVWLIRFSVFSVEVVPPKGGQSCRRLMLASNVLYFCLRPFSFFCPISKFLFVIGIVLFSIVCNFRNGELIRPD